MKVQLILLAASRSEEKWAESADTGAPEARQRHPTDGTFQTQQQLESMNNLWDIVQTLLRNSYRFFFWKLYKLFIWKKYNFFKSNVLTFFGKCKNLYIGNSKRFSFNMYKIFRVFTKKFSSQNTLSKRKTLNTISCRLLAKFTFFIKVLFNFFTVWFIFTNYLS